MARKREMDQLAKDAAAARAAGMSYGKWKALQEPVVEEAPKVVEIPEGWKRCPHCGKIFKPAPRKAKKYCEPLCQMAAARARDREERREYYREYRAQKRAEAKE